MATENTEKKNRGTLINILELDAAEGAKGISFDPEVEYIFQITERTARKLTSVKEDGHSKEFVVIEAMCTEQESKATIKQSFFYNTKVIINDEDKQKESDVIKFARGIGYDVGIGKKFVFGDVVREGITFKAHVKPQMQKDGKTPTGYSEIDLLTVKGMKGSSAPKQATITGSAADETVVSSMALGYPNKEALIPALAKSGHPNLINLAISMDAQGKLSYLK